MIFLYFIAFASCYAATIVIPVPPEPSAWQEFLKYFWAGLISTIAWAASSLPVLADWPGSAGRTKYKIIQSIVKAVFVGFLAFAGSTIANQNIVASYLAAATAAFGCDTYERRRQDKDAEK